MPPIKQFENQINQFHLEHAQHNQMIRQYDDVISRKANRMEVTQCRELIDKRTTFQFIEEFSDKLDERFDQNEKDHQKINEIIVELQKTMQDEVYQAVRKANVVIQKGMEKVMERREAGQTIDTYAEEP